MLKRTALALLLATAAACADGPTSPSSGFTLTCPQAMAVQTTTSQTPVTYAAPTSSGGQAPVTTTCSPASGSSFPIGTTLVNCQATDARGQTATCRLSVSVVRQPALEETRFLASGDSITAGEVTVPTTTTTLDVPPVLKLVVVPGASYPSQLLTRLQARYIAAVGDGQRILARLVGVGSGDPAVLLQAVDHIAAPLDGARTVAHRMQAGRPYRQRREIGHFRDRQFIDGLEIDQRGRRDAVGPEAEVDFVEIELKDLVLGIGPLDSHHQQGFLDLAGERHLVGQKEVLGDRWRNRGCALRTAVGAEVLGIEHHGAREARECRYRHAAEAGDVESFYALYVRNRLRHGIPPQPKRLFTAILERPGHDARAMLYLAEHEGTAVAGLIILRHNGVTYAKYEGVDETRRDLVALYPLIWKTIEDAVLAGDRVYDFGRTAADNPGLCEFKKRWGTTQTEMPYYFAPPGEGVSVVKSDSLKYRLFTGAFRRMPPALAIRVGERIFRHFG